LKFNSENVYKQKVEIQLCL